MTARTPLLTAVTLLAFASNSILCRLALAEGEIDAASFTFFRLAAGACFLYLILVVPNDEVRTALSKSKWDIESKTIYADIRQSFGSFQMATCLFLYAICFSFAYLSLSAATGGLILFGCVQATMIVVGIAKGERPTLLEWLGFGLALVGLVYLFLPRLEAPSIIGGSLMAIAGVSWGFYSLLGRSAVNPSLATTGNFLRATLPAMVPVVLGLLGLFVVRGTSKGIALAVVSGAITSGLGYVVWYHALKGLTATRAAVVQLAVPVIVALGGIAFLGEAMTPTLAISGLLILGGIAIVIASKSKK